jgi:hypothetical protein
MHICKSQVFANKYRGKCSDLTRMNEMGISEEVRFVTKLGSVASQYRHGGELQKGSVAGKQLLCVGLWELLEFC